MRIASRGMSGRFQLKSHLLPLKFSILFLLIAATGAFDARAQENPTGSLRGSVSAANGAAVEGAKVTVTNKTTGQTSVVQTNAAGAFEIKDMPPTDYALRVEAKDFISKSDSATIQAGPPTTISFVLDPEPVPGVLLAQRLLNLPLSNRNFLSYPQFEPGVETQDGSTIDPTKNGYLALSFDSRSGRAERVQFDRLDATDETVGTAAQNIPAGAVQEFRLGGLLAPFNDLTASAGRANVITRSGSNELHGDLFSAYRNGDVLSASMPGGHSRDWETQHYGGDIGGALIPDKLFVFVAAERNRRNAFLPVLLGGPFALVSPDLTRLHEPFTQIMGDGRLDYKLSETTSAFYRFTYDQNRDDRPFGKGPSLQPFLNRTNSPAHAVGVDFVSGAFTHSLRFEYLRYKNGIVDTSNAVSGFANPVPDVTIDLGGGAKSACAPGSFFCSGPSYLAPQQTYQSDLQFRYDGTHLRGAHVYHFGASYNRIRAGIFSPFYSLAPTLSAQGGAPVPANPLLGISGNSDDPLSYPVEWAFLGNGQGFASERPEFGLPGGGQRDNRISAYVGDTWKIRRNLTVNYGVNWVREDGKSDSDLGSIAQLNAWGGHLGDPVRQPNYNFAPQLAVAWDPYSSGRTMIRAGIGLYYDNEIFNNILFDRSLRLATGSYLATPAACIGGAPGSIQWPTNSGAAGTAVAGGAGIANANGTVSPTWCGSAIGVAAPQAVALQEAYQAAYSATGGANPNFIGTPGAFAGPYQNGLSLLAPNYQTPRSVQMDVGLQHELRPGLIFSVDYLRNITTRTLLGIDVNHGGAAANFNFANAVSDRDVAQTSNGCLPGTNQVSCMVAKLGPAGALASYGAAGIGGPAQVTGGAPCPFCAFPGQQPDLGVNVVDYPVGRSVYSGINVGLRQVLRNFGGHGIERATFQAAYSHSRYVSQVPDSGFMNQATDFSNPTRFTGPNDLDRTHKFALSAVFDLHRSLQLSFTGQFYSPLPVTLFLPQSSGGAEVLVSDVTGDGTTGDIVPGSNVGSYMRGIKPGHLASFIQNYNTAVVGGSTPVTPAGVALVNGGVFSLQELEQLGAVQQPLAAPVLDPAGLGWLKTFNVKLGWQHTYRDRFTFEPSISFFNLFNFANFDLPGNTQNGVLNFGAGSLSSFPTTFQPQNTVGGSSGGVNQPFSRTNRAGLGSGINTEGTPRAVEWGLRISF